MGVPDPIYPDSSRIRYRGTFDVQKLLKSIKGWFSARKYKMAEVKYSYKEGGDGSKVEYELMAFKKPNEYIKVTSWVKIWGRNMKDVEVIKDGQKIKTQEGFLIVEISGKVDLDPYKRFKGGASWLQTLRNLVNEYILHQDIFMLWVDSHENDMRELHRAIKEVLEFDSVK